MKKNSKQLLKKLKNKEVINYIIILVAATIAAIPLVNLQITRTDDGFIHILRVIGVSDIIKNGVFSPYIKQAFCNNFGYAINVFYPPVTTYGPLVFRLFINNYIDAIKAYTYFTIIISGISMYKLMKEMSNKNEIALISALIYIFLPYKLETIYDRFAIGEFSAYMFVPLVFLGLHNLLEGDKSKHYWITIGATGLMLTHTISTEYTALFSVIYLLLHLKETKNKEVIKKLATNIFFIVIISAFYIIPLWEYKIYDNYTIFSAEELHYTSDEVQETLLSPIQLVKDIEENGVSFKLGWPLIIVSLLGLFTYRKMSNDDKQTWLAFAIIGLISFAMTTFFPWSILPSELSTIQFAWRMLMYFEFVLAILGGYNVYTLIFAFFTNKSSKMKEITFWGIIILLIASMMKINYVYKFDKEHMDDKSYANWILEQKEIDTMSINREYLPENVRNEGYSYILSREDRTYILSGNATIKDEVKGNLDYTCTLENVEAGTILELPYINYPGYTVEIEYNGKKERMDCSGSENGFLQISISENLNDVTLHLHYTGTNLEKISYIISVAGVIGFAIYIICEKRKGKLNVSEN